jgi:hypothetical protein
MCKQIPEKTVRIAKTIMDLESSPIFTRKLISINSTLPKKSEGMKTSKIFCMCNLMVCVEMLLTG